MHWLLLQVFFGHQSLSGETGILVSQTTWIYYRWNQKTSITSKSNWSIINTIYVKQQQRWLYHFQVHFKYMLGNVYIEIHARQCLCILSLYCKEGFTHPFNFIDVSEGILHV